MRQRDATNVLQALRLFVRKTTPRSPGTGAGPYGAGKTHICLLCLLLCLQYNVSEKKNKRERFFYSDYLNFYWDNCNFYIGKQSATGWRTVFLMP